MIKDVRSDLFKRTDPDTPKRWNCCDMLVPPRDLAQHIKKYHMDDHRWTDSERIDIINIMWLLASFFAILILQ